MRRLGYWLGLIVILSTGAGLPAASQAAHLVMPGETSPESAAPLRPKPTSPSDHPVPVPLPGADPTSAVDTGAGAVLCTWSIYLSVRTDADRCGLPATQSTIAIDEAIAAMDAFIIANSSVIKSRNDLER